MQSTCHSRHILIRLEYFREIFEKFLNIKFHENLFSVAAQPFYADRGTTRT